MRICFFGEVYEALTGNVIGGSELQMALLAQALSKEGHEVLVIDTNLDKVVDNIGNIKIYNCAKGGIKKLRFFTQKLPNFLKLSYRVNADIYYVRGRSYSQIFPWIISRIILNKIFIKAISSDIDVLPFKERLTRTFKTRKSLPEWMFRGIITETLFTIILKRASLLLLQHKEQDSSALSPKPKKFVFQNLFTPPVTAPKINNRDRNSFIYIGTLSLKKGLLQLKTIIEKLPEIHFQIIGPPENKEDLLFQSLISLKNIQYHGKQDHTYIFRLLENSLGLINVSPAEGFPNTFIESWYYGCPVLSLNVDPGDVISSQNLGFVCKGDEEMMIENINRLNEGTLPFNPFHLRDYVVLNHSSENAAKKFVAILEDFQRTRGQAS
jgi:hypothetical protein